MICGIFGLPGAGKTTFLTWLALRAKAGKPLVVGHFSYKQHIGSCRKYERVFCNVPLDGVYKLDFEALGKYDFSHSLILIDEIGTLCDSRNWKEFGDSLRDFISLHRHYDCDICYFSQALDTDKKIRDRTALVFYIQRRGEFTLVSPIKKDWSFGQQMKERFIECPPLACSWIYRPIYYQAFDSFEAPPLEPNPAPIWNDVFQITPFVPPLKRFARKAKQAAQACAAVCSRIIAAVKQKFKKKKGVEDYE